MLLINDFFLFYSRGLKCRLLFFIILVPHFFSQPFYILLYVYLVYKALLRLLILLLKNYEPRRIVSFLVSFLEHNFLLNLKVLVVNLFFANQLYLKQIFFFITLFSLNIIIKLKLIYEYFKHYLPSRFLIIFMKAKFFDNLRFFILLAIFYLFNAVLTTKLFQSKKKSFDLRFKIHLNIIRFFNFFCPGKYSRFFLILGFFLFLYFFFFFLHPIVC